MHSAEVPHFIEFKYKLYAAVGYAVVFPSYPAITYKKQSQVNQLCLNFKFLIVVKRLKLQSNGLTDCY